MGMPLPYWPHPDYECYLAAAYCAFGTVDFAKGQVMTLEEAVEYALGDEAQA